MLQSHIYAHLHLGFTLISVQGRREGGFYLTVATLFPGSWGKLILQLHRDFQNLYLLFPTLFKPLGNRARSY